MPYDPTKFEDRVAIARETFAALIAADAYIASAPAFPVITEEKGDIAASITQALSGLGLCIVVVAADADEVKTKGPTTLVLRVRYVAQVSEKVLFNKAKATAAGVPYRPAAATMLRVLKAVHGRANGLDPAGGRHIPGINEFAVLTDRPFQLVNSTSEVVYEVSATTWIEI